MSIIMLITLVVIFAVILSMRRARRRPRVTQIDRTMTRKKGDGE
jgi:heme/copper-type cytochrome/quinol oxidase subunit 2